MSTRFKESIKTGLAFAMVFGIAMSFDWLNPYWAGWAVAVCSLPTVGDSMRKGAFRILGTLPGCAAALAIHALAPQERWLFMFLTCSWMFFTTYLMVSRPKDSYVWVMAGYVCLAILLSDLDSSENMFESAVFRTVETVMGVVVYTLIAVFIWPQTNTGAVKKSSIALAAALADLYRHSRETMLGERTQQDTFQSLHAKTAQQLTLLGTAVQAEGLESYEVSEIRVKWDRFIALSTNIMRAIGRWQSGLAELSSVHANAGTPAMRQFFAELDGRFDSILALLAGSATTPALTSIQLEPDLAAQEALPIFDRAAMEVARIEMMHLHGLTSDLVQSAMELRGLPPNQPTARPRPTTPPAQESRSPWLPVPDWEHLRSAAFVAVTTGVGFLIWIVFDPPGHSGWFQITGTIALLVALVPTLPANRLILPVAVTSAVCMLIYLLVMPQLSTFLGLGSLLFVLMFSVCYFTAGMTRFLCNLSILTLIPIQNRQVYAFAVVANLYIFLVMAFGFLYVMSFMLSSTRPEKAFLRLMDRFFCSAEFLMLQSTPGRRQYSFLNRWRVAFHERQLRAMPLKLEMWGKSINQRGFPDNTPERIHGLVTSIQCMVHRIDQFLEVSRHQRVELSDTELRENLVNWHGGLRTIFDQWSRRPEAEPVAALTSRLEAAIKRIESRIAGFADRSGPVMDRHETENFLRLLGGYRGVSEAAIAYAGAAQLIGWAHWREERFS